MLKKGTKLYSILTGSCPKCHEESMYMGSNPYRMADTLKMHERCSHCGTKYKIEPSFFYGAMYVSYAVGIAFSATAFVISYVFLDSTLQTAFFAIWGTLIAFMPIILRLSRNIWINIFIDFEKKLTLKNQKVTEDF
ncbi:MAG: DUF983 domain-containing protein [Flavobacteriaceae bacterium]